MSKGIATKQTENKKSEFSTTTITCICPTRCQLLNPNQIHSTFCPKNSPKLSLLLILMLNEYYPPKLTNIEGNYQGKIL